MHVALQPMPFALLVVSVRRPARLVRRPLPSGHATAEARIGVPGTDLGRYSSAAAVHTRRPWPMSIRWRGVIRRAPDTLRWPHSRSPRRPTVTTRRQELPPSPRRSKPDLREPSLPELSCAPATAVRTPADPSHVLVGQ